MNLNDSTLLTISEFARKIKTSRPTVMRMIEEGKILAFRLSDIPGSHYRIKSTEIERLISWELEKKNNPSLFPKTSTRGFKRIYGIWIGMIERCNNPKSKPYKWYGQKGITVCDRWKIFDNFLDDMGIAPKPWSINRINNELGYFLENCVWSTYEAQANNKTNTIYFEYEGKKMTFSDFCKKKNLNYHTAHKRKLRGATIEQILFDGPLKLFKNKNKKS
jgi:excisionase family DNA binding protein